MFTSKGPVQRAIFCSFAIAAVFVSELSGQSTPDRNKSPQPDWKPFLVEYLSTLRDKSQRETQVADLEKRILTADLKVRRHLAAIMLYQIQVNQIELQALTGSHAPIETSTHALGPLEKLGWSSGDEGILWLVKSLRLGETAVSDRELEEAGLGMFRGFAQLVWSS